MPSNLTTAHSRCILLDIEGTTTPIAFVHDVLFPYARSQVRTYLAEHFGSEETITDLARLRDEHAIDVKQNLNPPALVIGPKAAERDSFVEYLHWLIDHDRKSTGLKALQGKIWRQGYLDGTLKAPLFPDVAPALERWHGRGLKIGIFSSGSVLAQKLLFAHTEAGDLTRFLDYYFDTTTGPKTGVENYRRIATATNLSSREILFISDVVGELEAANAADMKTLLCVRPGNHVQPHPERYQSIHTFDKIP